MVHITGNVDPKLATPLIEAVEAYAAANKNVSMADGLVFNGITGAFRRDLAGVLYFIVRDTGNLDPRQQVSAGAANTAKGRRLQGKRDRREAAQVAATTGDDGLTGEAAFAQLKKGGFIKAEGKGFRLAGKPPKFFADKAALVEHLGGPKAAPVAEGEAKKVSKTAAKKTATKAGKPAKKAARKR